MKKFKDLVNLLGYDKKEIDKTFIQEGIDGLNKKYLINGIIVFEDRGYEKKYFKLINFIAASYPFDHFGSQYSISFEPVIENDKGEFVKKFTEGHLSNKVWEIYCDDCFFENKLEIIKK